MLHNRMACHHAAAPAASSAEQMRLPVNAGSSLRPETAGSAPRAKAAAVLPQAAATAGGEARRGRRWPALACCTEAWCVRLAQHRERTQAAQRRAPHLRVGRPDLDATRHIFWLQPGGD